MRPDDDRSQTLKAAAIGVLAVAAAMKIGSWIHLTPSPGQLPGFAKSTGFDPTADVLRLALLVLLPLLAGVVSGRLLRPKSHFGLLALSVFLVAGAAAASLGPRKAVTIGAIAAATAALGRRKLAGVTNGNGIGLVTAIAASILTWSFLAGPAASRGWSPIATGLLLLLLATAEAGWIGRGHLERGARNFAISASLLPIALWGSRPQAVSWMAGIGVLALPAAWALWRRRSEQWSSLCRHITTRFLIPGSFVALAASACLRLPPMADVFEDGHGLLPASEYLRGERPYEDIIPGHGLLSDGGLQVVSLRLFGDNYIGLRRGVKVAGVLFWPAIYYVGFAATGSAVVGFWGLVLSFLWFPQYMFFRVIASLLTLALASAAARTRSRSLWIAAGAALPLAILSSVDFGSYAAAGCAVALCVSRGGFRSAIAPWALGALLSAVAGGVLLASFGSLFAFIAWTFVGVGRLVPVYALGFQAGTSEIRRWLSGWSFLSNPESFLGCAIVGFAALLAILAARFPRLGQRGRALAPVLAWFLAAVGSVLERHHFGYPAFVLPLLIVLVARWIRNGSGWDSARGALAAAVVGAFVFCAQPPVIAVAVADALVHTRVPGGVAELDSPRRASGALFSNAQRMVVSRVGEFLETKLGPLDTWLDFSNTPGLYYLFNRDCPIRFYEVPFYETDSAQDQVVRAVQGNPHVRAVLVRTGLLSDAIDGIPNEERAPRVAQFIRRQFHPSFSRDGVEFWARNIP